MLDRRESRVIQSAEAPYDFISTRPRARRRTVDIFPENRTDLAALRVVVRRGFTHDLADMLVADIERQLPRLQKQPSPVHDAASGSAFAH